MEQKTDKEWKNILTPEQYQITREKGTEQAFSGKYYDFFKEGIYKCTCCGNILFKSEQKFFCSCGWPSFYDKYSENSVEYKKDSSLGAVRKEVLCKNCNAHLGHVFEDGPEPTGLRYCINSIALNFEEAK